MSEATIFVAESGAARVSPDGPVRQPANSSYVELGPAFAGAVVAAAAFFVLLVFASAIGLAVSSASPTWRDTSVGLTVLSGAWVVLSAVGSFALGGYIAGRLRARWDATADEILFPRRCARLAGMGPSRDHRCRHDMGSRYNAHQ